MTKSITFETNQFVGLHLCERRMALMHANCAVRPVYGCVQTLFVEIPFLCRLDPEDPDSIFGMFAGDGDPRLSVRIDRNSKLGAELIARGAVSQVEEAE
jgi:hypothetical protein